MHGSHEFLTALAVIMCVAAVTTVVFQRLHQPVVLGYMLAGLVIGPYIPIPLVADPEIVQTLSEVGVILLMFSLGLEFSLRKLLRVGPTAGITAVIQCSIMLWLGFVTAGAFGWTPREAIFTGALIAISSTTIIAKAFDEQRIAGRLREFVVGVLIVEDLVAILLLALLTAISAGDGLTAGVLARSIGRLVLFLVGLMVVGLLIVPRTIRAVTRLQRPETLLVASVGVCFAISLLALQFGYSVALGAFLAGSLVAESGEEKQVEHLVHPVRDIFAAVFFVSVGMLIDPALVLEHWPAVVVLTLVVVFGKVVSVALGSFLAGNGVRLSVQSGMSLAQIGEFSFIIAALGVGLGATRSFLYPVAVAVSAITTLMTPWLIRWSGPVASFVDRKLPHQLQTFAALYGSWIEQSRTARRQTAGALGRKLVRALLLDAVLLGVVIVGAALATDRITVYLGQVLNLKESASRVLVLVAAVAVATPLCIGIFRIARRLGLTIAAVALPRAASGKLDPAAAPRGALVVTIQLAVVLLIGLPLLALTQPFLPGMQGAIALVLVLAVLGFAFWRGTTNLEGHVRAGAEVIVEALATSRASDSAPADLADVRRLLPGLGEPTSVRLEPGSRAVGNTLAALDLRGQTGAMVLAISRTEDGVIAPTAREVLRAGDVLALVGTREAVEAAKEVLLSP